MAEEKKEAAEDKKADEPAEEKKEAADEDKKADETK